MPLGTPSSAVVVEHVAVVNHSTLPADRDLAFWVEAVRLQMQKHIAPAWGIPAPGVTLYANTEDSILNDSRVAIIGIVDDDGNAESAGFHTNFAGRVYGIVDMGQSRQPSVTLSHELAELYGNPAVDRWVDGPDGRKYAVELCDPVERDTYEIEVELFGQKRNVPVSDFVFPAYFGLPNPAMQGLRFLVRQIAELNPAPGGYQIAQDANGATVYLSRGEMHVGRSVHNRTDRIRRRPLSV